jgi:rhodanese-related sulfurtransferase
MPMMPIREVPEVPMMPEVLCVHAATDVHAQHERFERAEIAPDVAALPPERRRAAFHYAVQHLLPGALLVHAAAPELDELAEAFDLEPVAGDDVTRREWRRTTRTTIHDLVHEARASIRRIAPIELAERLASDGATGGRPPLVIDTRTPTDRVRFGVIAGSIHAPRTVLEWHLDPANGYRHALKPAFDDPIVVVCNGGYSSSLAAANLVRLGFADVADLVGGVHAWRAAGLPVVAPDHSHLDL